MNNLDLNKLQEFIDKRIEEAIDKVEWQFEKTEEYSTLHEELWKLEQTSVPFYKLSLGEAANLSEEDAFTCRQYVEICEKIERIGWKLMYIQGIKDSLNILDELINQN